MPPHIVFFFNDTATTEIYTLSLHDALPISRGRRLGGGGRTGTRRRTMTWVLVALLGLVAGVVSGLFGIGGAIVIIPRSEEHTSELQSQSNLVCRLLLEKKNKKANPACCEPR